MNDYYSNLIYYYNYVCSAYRLAPDRVTSFFSKFHPLTYCTEAWYNKYVEQYQDYIAWKEHVNCIRTPIDPYAYGFSAQRLQYLLPTIEIVNSKGGIVFGIDLPYNNSKNKLHLQCSEGHEWKATIDTVKNGNYCGVCSGKSKSNAIRTFFDLVTSKGGIVLSPYIAAHSDILMQCPCGFIWHGRPGNMKANGAFCPKCAKNSQISAIHELYSLMDAKNYTPLEFHNDSNTPFAVMCSKGHTWYPNHGSLLKGHGCSWCYGNSNKLGEFNFLKEVQENGYTLLSEYRCNNQKVRLRCKYGHEWDVSPGHIKSDKTGCNRCNCPKGERILSNILEELQQANYITSHTFQYVHPELPDYRYDFMVEYNGKKYIVEFDGYQHFMFVDYFHKDMEAYYRKRNIDKLKQNAVLKDGMNVIRIDYSHLFQARERLYEALSLQQQIYYAIPSLYSYLK